jgi:Fe-S-cluster containining protein
MFQLGKTIVSEDVLVKDFVCNLSACHGACCIDGDAGAPLSKEETEILEDIFPKIKPFLRPEGIQVIEEKGTWVVGTDQDLETPLIENKDCAYVIFDGKTALCGIEQAYNQGLIDWKKPVSCHLYPVRIKEFSSFAAVNYDRWDICNDACALGKELQIPVYKFVKEALIRRFGKEWYEELELVATEWEKENKKRFNK